MPISVTSRDEVAAAGSGRPGKEIVEGSWSHAAAMTIEQLVAGDGERLRAIRLRALRDAPDAFGATLEEAEARPPEDWDDQLEQLATFVATLDGCDMGLVRAVHHDHLRDAGCLISMWVEPEGRRQGIGSALVDAVVNWARTRGLKRLLLDVVERNTPAIALYARKGFVPSGAIGTLPPPRDHIREIQLVMML
jgi:GNAT superfamily N-acetyltransferase